MNLPFVMLRKKWKLPWKVEQISYSLEYWENIFEIQKWAIKKWEKIAIVDDLLATWWSAKACVDLIEKMWWKIDSLNFLIELWFLKWREKFNGKNVCSLVVYE